MDKEVTQVPYYTYSVTYTYEGKEHHCTTGGYFSTTEPEKGTPTEIVIDSSDPEYMITETQTGKSDLFLGWFYFLSSWVSLPSGW